MSEPSHPSIAPVLGTLTPYLSLENATQAAEFYQKAFDAKVVAAHPLDDKGRTMHVHLHLNGASLMLSDPYPEYGHPYQKPQGYNLTLQVKNIDAQFERAAKAGCEVVMPVQQMFWGDRYGQLRDPFGVLWSMNQSANS